MIHVVTVHWMDSKWVGPQLDYLQRNLELPYRTWASLEGIADPTTRARFDVVEDFEGMHAPKLNWLADMVLEVADPEDLLVFIDGDAFPIRPIGAWMTEMLQRYPLAAVRRDEEREERQPHPCFCVTTAGFWKQINGDWQPGGTWKSPSGLEITDVGGTLYNQLRDEGVEWLPLLRSNTHELHPVWFAVYAGHVYHHGAGFRRRVARTDVQDNRYLASPRLRDTARLYRQLHIGVGDLVRRLNPTSVRTALRGLRQELPTSDQARFLAEASAQSDGIYRELTVDPEFYRQFETT
jgi:hypothetical protein